MLVKFFYNHLNIMPTTFWSEPLPTSNLQSDRHNQKEWRRCYMIPRPFRSHSVILWTIFTWIYVYTAETIDTNVYFFEGMPYY